MANEDPTEVGELVFQLVHGNPQLYQYALRILNSHLMPGAEVENIVPLIKKQLMKESMDKALKFSKLEERLSGLCRPLSSLYLLYQLSATQKFTFIPPTPALMHNNNSSNSSLPTAVPSQPTTTLFSAGEITSHTFNNSHTILPSQMSRLSFTVNQSSDKQQQLDSGYMSHNQTTHEKSIKANPLKSVKPSAGFVGDGIILNDLLFVFQGSDGQFIRWNAHKQAYYIDPKVENPVRAAVERILQLPACHHHISDYLSKLETKKSLTLQALKYAIEQELTAYQKYMTSIEKRLDERKRLREEPLSLQHLLVYQQQPLERMQTAFRLLKQLTECGAATESEIVLNRLYTLMDHGSLQVSKFAFNLMQQTSKPFLAIISRWLNEGVLEDPFGEFFINLNNKNNIDTFDDVNCWVGKFQLQLSKLPAFLTAELGDKIFRLGKALDFLRNVCNERFQIQSRHLPRDLTFEYLTGDFAVALDKDYQAISGYLMRLFRDKYNLPKYLTLLKQYLLIGQGDFCQNLMEQLEQDLDKPCDALHRHCLIDALEFSLKNSSCAFPLESEMLRHLDVLIHAPVNPTDLGWDVFSLTFTLDPAADVDRLSATTNNSSFELKTVLGTIFNQPSRLSYLRLFRYCWWIRRLSFGLDKVWRIDSSLYRQSKGQELLKLIYRTRMEMSHFISQLQLYVQFDVVDCAWQRLVSFIDGQQGDLDCLIEAHSAYLQELNTFALFKTSTDQGEMLGQVMECGKCVLAFCRLHAQYVRVIESNEKEGQLEKTKIQKEIKETRRKFLKQLEKFLELIEKDGDLRLKRLFSRIQFNDWSIAAATENVAC